MKALQVTMAVLAGVVLGVLPGCHRKTAVHERSHEEVVYVEEPAYVVVPQPPPQIIVETRPPPPSSEYIWVDGYWGWDNHRYLWQRGRWVMPPRGRAVWVGPRYEPHEHNYHYTPGHWAEDHPQGPQERPRGDEGHRDRH